MFSLPLLSLFMLLPPGAPLASRVIAEAIQQAESEARRLPGSYSFRVVQAPVIPLLPGKEPRVEFTHLSKKDPVGRFFAAFKLSVDGHLVGYTRVDLDGTWSGKVLRARESLPRKTVLADAMLELVPVEGTPPPGALTSIPEGLRLRQPVNAGRIVTFADLEPVPLVHAGERVRLTATGDGLVIVAEATARSTGGLGQRVRVELQGSRKSLQAKVSGEGQTTLEGFPAAK